MTIQIDAHSSGGTGTGDTSWTHTPAGTPRGVIVMVVQDDFTSDEVIGVTYGGVTMGEVALSPFFFTAPAFEKAVLYGYFLGNSIPTGAQTVAVDVDATGSTKAFAAITVTAASDTAVHDTSTLSTTSDSAPNVTMTVTAETIAMAALHSGNAVVSAITPGSAFTQINEHDFGGTVCGFIRSTSTHSASNYDVDWTSSLATSQGILGIAIRELAAAAVGQVTETDLAQPISVAPRRLISQSLETDTANVITAALAGEQVIAVAQAMEADLAQAVTFTKSRAVAQVTETDLAQPITTARIRAVGQAEETDLAQFIRAPLLIESATELDRARQIAVVGGAFVVSDVPVLIRAPSKAGRVFHEIEYKGDTYHPNVNAWQAEEEAPGGFGPATGRVSDRIYHAHRDVFRAGANWYSFLEDGTCLHAGRLLEPDTSQGEVQLSDRGVSRLADREIGPILYQTHVGSEISRFSSDSDQWRVTTTTMKNTFEDTAIVFQRQADQDEGDAVVIIPFFGRDLAYLRMHMQGSEGYISVQTLQRTRLASIQNSAELDTSGSSYENYYFNFSAAQDSENVEVDLVLASGALSFPNTTVFTNAGDIGTTGSGFVYPDIITIEVSDWASTASDSEDEIVLSNIEINGVAVGEKQAFSAHDLVADVAALIGIRYTQIEGGSFNVLPYELPPGTPATEALDFASLVSGKRWRILHNGNYPVLEFGAYSENRWGLASPWSPFDAIPQDRYDAVAIPYEYPGTQGQLSDQVIVKLKDSPLDRRNVYWELALQDAAHNQDQARALGGRVVEELVRKRNAGSFAAASVIGPDGLEHSAHHMNAGDTLFPMRIEEPGRLHIGRLTRYDDHVQGEFDGENRALERLLARREKKVARKKA